MLSHVCDNALTQLFTSLRVSQGMSKHPQSCAVWSAMQLLMTCVFWSSQVTEVLWVSNASILLDTCIVILVITNTWGYNSKTDGSMIRERIEYPRCKLPYIRKILRFGQYVVYHAYTGSTEKVTFPLESFLCLPLTILNPDVLQNSSSLRPNWFTDLSIQFRRCKLMSVS